MMNHSPPLRALAAGFAVVFILSFASTDLAQSGRRARKPEPAPVSSPEPTPTPTPNAEKPKPGLSFLVGLNRHDGFADIPYYAYEGVLRTVSGRLRDSAHVLGTQDEMNRGDAVKKAKAEKEGYVVWLQLRAEGMSGDYRNRNLDYIIIEYSVFAPTTAKITTSGRTYVDSQRNRGVILGPGTSGIYGDRYLIMAAQEAADRILAHFRLSSRPIRLP